MHGIIGEIDLNVQHAADGRHSPIVKSAALPENGNAEIKAGELLFNGSNTVDGATAHGATPAAGANRETLSAAGDGSTTVFEFSFAQDILPGSVLVTTNDTTAQEVEDNGDGTLAGDGTGSASYAAGKIQVTFATAPANGKTITITAITAADFLGVNDAQVATDDGTATIVLHGTIFEGIATVNGTAASTEQLKFLARHGIY